MKVVGHPPGAHHANVLGQALIRPVLQSPDRELAGEPQMRHLSPRVDPGVGASSAMDNHLTTDEVGQRLF